jgi:hypothetical protein
MSRKRCSWRCSCRGTQQTNHKETQQKHKRSTKKTQNKHKINTQKNTKETRVAFLYMAPQEPTGRRCIAVHHDQALCDQVVNCCGGRFMFVFVVYVVVFLLCFFVVLLWFCCVSVGFLFCFYWVFVVFLLGFCFVSFGFLLGFCWVSFVFFVYVLVFLLCFCWVSVVFLLCFCLPFLCATRFLRSFLTFFLFQCVAKTKDAHLASSCSRARRDFEFNPRAPTINGL